MTTSRWVLASFYRRTVAVWIALSVATCPWSVARSQPAEPAARPSPGERQLLPPHGYHVEERPIRWLMVYGAGAAGSFFATSLVVGIASGAKYAWLFAPLFGPIVQGAILVCETDDPGCGVRSSLFVALGIGQVAGMALFAIGALATERVLVADRLE